MSEVVAHILTQKNFGLEHTYSRLIPLNASYLTVPKAPSS